MTDNWVLPQEKEQLVTVAFLTEVRDKTVLVFKNNQISLHRCAHRPSKIEVHEKLKQAILIYCKSF